MDTHAHAHAHTHTHTYTYTHTHTHTHGIKNVYTCVDQKSHLGSAGCYTVTKKTTVLVEETNGIPQTTAV